MDCGWGQESEMIALGFWDGLDQDSIINTFEPDKYGSMQPLQIDRTGVEVLFAWYDDPYGYSGVAFLLFKKDGEYYTVDGSHCSCYGLEGQWTPVRVTLAYLRQRLDEGLGIYGGYNSEDYFATKLTEFLNSLEN